MLNLTVYIQVFNSQELAFFTILYWFKNQMDFITIPGREPYLNFTRIMKINSIISIILFKYNLSL